MTDEETTAEMDPIERVSSMLASVMADDSSESEVRREQLVREARNELSRWLDERPPTDHLERLREAARDRWDDKWTIDARHYADGTVQAWAYHSRRRLDVNEHDFGDDANVFEQEGLWIGPDGERVVQREHIRGEDRETIEVLEDTHGLLEPSPYEWFTKDPDGRWHAVIEFPETDDSDVSMGDFDHREQLACGVMLEPADQLEKISNAPTDIDGADVCDACLTTLDPES
ncbi:hypothetical protein [Natronoarchaeum rubrum]|uniref:hypothetical protein n=1 Tax=Natronoarchaeum rubrum TaxID=755311 RepID=UPI002113280D|nr:hypothetical protein [Natronoarchaeum rubrum]